MSGLHAKLERKKAVEHHNAEAQKTFADHMDTHFKGMKNSVRENHWKQQLMLDSYTHSVGKYCCFVLHDGNLQTTFSPPKFGLESGWLLKPRGGCSGIPCEK